jgi:hypothetical protein
MADVSSHSNFSSHLVNILIATNLKAESIDEVTV